METTKDIASTYGLQKGYGIVYYFSDFGKSKVYVAERDSEENAIGYPTFIIVENLIPRLSSIEETMSILELKSIDNGSEESL